MSIPATTAGGWAVPSRLPVVATAAKQHTTGPGCTSSVPIGASVRWTGARPGRRPCGGSPAAPPTRQPGLGDRRPRTPYFRSCRDRCLWRPRRRPVDRRGVPDRSAAGSTDLRVGSTAPAGLDLSGRGRRRGTGHLLVCRQRAAPGDPVVAVRPQLTVDTTDFITYEQIRAQLADLIVRGVLTPHERLPTVRQLAADLGLATGTVARSYQELEHAGMIVTRRGAGTRVRARRRVGRRRSSRVNGRRPRPKARRPR